MKAEEIETADKAPQAEAATATFWKIRAAAYPA